MCGTVRSLLTLLLAGSIITLATAKDAHAIEHPAGGTFARCFFVGGGGPARMRLPYNRATRASLPRRRSGNRRRTSWGFYNAS